MPRWDGSCHCQRVRFRIEADALAANVCNCTICEMKGFIHAIIELSQFELISGEDELTTYRFNTGLAKHQFCRHCGVHPFYIPRSDPDKVDVNVRCLEGVDIDTLEVQRFDGKNWERAIASAPWKQPAS